MKIDSFVRQLGNWSAGKAPLHSQLATAVVRRIEDGVFLPGSRLPAERVLAEALTVSRTTVLHAYETLRTGAWIESRHGSGTWVSLRKAKQARQEAYASVLEQSSVMSFLESSAELIDLALALPEPLPGVIEQLNSFAGEWARAIVCQRLYPAHGLIQLRGALASNYESIGLATQVEQLLITTGAQQALSLIVGLYVQRGDTVLVENPTYFGVLDILRLAGARLVPLDVSRHHVSPRLLRDRIVATGARLIFLTPTHHNPTGITMPETARRQIAQIGGEFGIPLVEDASLDELRIDGAPAPPIAQFSRSGTVLTVGSLSKLYWPGLRVGWIRGPHSAVQQLARLKKSLDLGASILSQTLAVSLMQDIGQARKLRTRQLKTRRDLLIALIRQKLPEWDFSTPPGGLSLWVRLPGADAIRFSQFCLRHEVAVGAGPTFSTDEGFQEYLRIPFLIDEASLTLGVERLAHAWSGFRPAQPP
jgi:DNA-binding transcriptional MocR family regulator